MIKIVQRQDIEDVLTGNIDAVKSVVYYTHLMAAEDGIHPLIKREGDVLRCKLFSDQISELITGNLICQVEIAKIDDEYPDREFNEIKKKNLNIWIKGKDPQDETLRVGYENLTNGLKQAVDKANTSVQPDDLTHYVKIEDFETQISEKVDRNDVYVKDEIDTKINTLRGEIPSTAGFATEQWVESKGYLTEHQDLSGYVEKSEINNLVSITELENSLRPYATEQWVESKGYLTEHQQLKTINGETITGSGDIKISGATETWVEEKISTKVDRADVYVKDEIDTKINTLRGEIPSTAGFVTEQWVESKGYLTQHQSLKTINGETITGSGDIKIIGATETWVETQISTKVDRNDVYVKDEIDTKINTLRGEIPSLDGFATETWVENKGYLTAHQDLSGYVKKSEITDLVSITALENSLKPYAKETWVEEKISTKVDRPDVYVKSEIDTQINTLRGEIPSIDGLATEQWVESKGYLTEHQSLAGLATEQWVESKGYLTEHQSLAGFATETWVENKGYLTQHQDISGKLDSNSIWSGTAEEWELVTDKSKYIIALVK